MNKFSLVSKWKGKFYCPLYRVSTTNKALSIGLMLSLMHVDYNTVHASPIHKTIQEEILVRGKVTSQGSGVQDVSVFVKGKKSIGTKTNSAGTFTLEVPKGATLVFTSIGFKMQEVKAGPSLIVDLIEDASLLEEAIVVGFGTQKKINLTGAVDQISAKQLENRPVTNIGAALQGMIPNLNITNPSGNPSEGAKFNIRGTTSLNGGVPLILVDNIPYSESELARLNPNDFETVTVLKDAAVAAIYGARAAFGVVLITTKSAKSGDVQVNLGYNTSIRTVGKMPEVVTDPLTVMEYKRMAAAPLYDLFPDAVRDYAKKMQEDPSLPNVILDPINKLNYMYYGSTDWMDEAYKKSAPAHTVNLSIGKKADKLTYLFSGEYYRQDGMLKYGADQLNRYNARGKVDFQLKDWLSFGTNTLITSRDYESPVFMDGDFFWNVNRTSSLDIPKNPDGSWTSAGAGLLGRMQDGGRRRRTINEFQTTFSAKASIIKDIWDVNADVTFRRTSGNSNAFDLPIPYRTGPETEIKYAGSTTSYASRTNDNDKYDVVNIYTNFKKEFDKHHVQALLGYNQEYRKNEYSAMSRNNLLSPEFPTVELATGPMSTNHSIDDWALQGLFYRLNYNYDGKYLIELNGRYDGSSRFPEGDRWGFFPSVSGAWVASEERFFESIKPVVNLFKFRGSYGQLGNQNVYDSNGNLLSYPYIPFLQPYKVGQWLGGERPTSLRPPEAVAKSLTWEKVSTVNFGVDLALLNNRLNVNFDAYTRKTEDMVIPGRTLPGVFGTASPRFNAADLKNKGWELRLGWNDQFDLSNSPFKYNVAFVISNSQTHITKYHNPTGNLKDHYAGKLMGEIWGLEYDGVFENQAQIDALNQVDIGNDNQGNNSYIGDIKFKDLNDDKRINFGKNTLEDHGDRVIVGNSSTQYPYSLDLGADWKGFNARVFLQGVGKKDWYPGGGQVYFWGIYAQPWTNVTKQNLDHWTPENPNGYFPAVRAYAAEVNDRSLTVPNKKYMQDASYMRVKNITLGYTLPKQWLERTGLGRVHFYFSGENLFEKTNLKVSLDPEGLDGKIYPFQRTYSFGMNLNF